MPSRADDSFLPLVRDFSGSDVRFLCQCPLGLMTHFYNIAQRLIYSKPIGVNALSGLYLISTVPLQKPRFYAVSRAYFCRYLSEYSDRSSFSCMFTIWTYLTRQIFPNPEFTIAQNYSSVILFFTKTIEEHIRLYSL